MCIQNRKSRNIRTQMHQLLQRKNFMSKNQSIQLHYKLYREFQSIDNIDSSTDFLIQNIQRNQFLLLIFRRICYYKLNLPHPSYKRTYYCYYRHLHSSSQDTHNFYSANCKILFALNKYNIMHCCKVCRYNYYIEFSQLYHCM